MTPTATRPSSRTPSSLTQPGDVRILVVENDRISQLVAVRMLQRHGCRVEAAGDGLQAVQSCERQRYDLILMDCQMPLLDGFEATARIRALAEGERSLIVAVTASVMEGDRERCLAAGMDDYIAKPLTLRLIDDLVRRWFPRMVSACPPSRREWP